MIYDNTNVKITVKHWNHPTQLFPDIYGSILPRGSKVRDLKRDLLNQGFGGYGWTSREMMLTLTGATFVLHYDYRFNSNATVTLRLIVHFSSAANSSSNINNNST